MAIEAKLTLRQIRFAKTRLVNSHCFLTCKNISCSTEKLWKNIERVEVEGQIPFARGVSAHQKGRHQLVFSVGCGRGGG